MSTQRAAANDDATMTVALLAAHTDIITPEEAAQLLERHSGPEVLAVVLKHHDTNVVLAAIAGLLNMSFMDLQSGNVDFDADVAAISDGDHDLLRRQRILPVVSQDGERRAVVIADPFDVGATNTIKTRWPGIDVVMGNPIAITDELIGIGGGEAVTVGDDDMRWWLDRILERAVAERASDIEFSYNTDNKVQVRMRVDSAWRPIPANLGGRDSQAVGTLLHRAGMDSANLITIQDGSFSGHHGDRDIDARVNLVPQENGPCIVVRILDTTTTRLNLGTLGLSDEIVTQLRRAVNSQGTVITSGPTGSGKTTTMWALLHELDPVTQNIKTIEDPIEYRLAGVGQIPVRAAQGLGFSEALRAVLRQAPDVVLVGEIRDRDTAEVAMNAAITGHTVLSTIHANSAPAVVSRLVHMGVARWMVADSLTVVCSQRLVRRLHDCARWEPPTELERSICERLGLDVPEALPHAVGCSQCARSGYSGRLLVMEIMEVSDELSDAIRAEATPAEMENVARQRGYRSLLEDGLRRVEAGDTTLTEIDRISER